MTINKISNYNFVPLKGYESFEATTQIIIKEIIERGLEWEVIDANNNLIAVHYSGREYIIHEGTISDGNSLIAYWLSNNKWMTKQMLHRKGISYARGVILSAGNRLEDVSIPPFPLVVKPADTDHGLGVSTSITTIDELKTAVDKAFRLSDKVIIEQFHQGCEYRFLVIDGVVRAIAYREPANITGDGVNTISRLIDMKNVGRGDDYRHPLLKILIDDEVIRHLALQGLTPDSVVAEGRKIYLRHNSNLSTGGDSIDVTEEIGQGYKNVAVKAADALGLRIAGVDMIIADVDSMPALDNHIVIELNAPAMLSMHDYPYIGKNRNVEKYVLDCILNS